MDFVIHLIESFTQIGVLLLRQIRLNIICLLLLLLPLLFSLLLLLNSLQFVLLTLIHCKALSLFLRLLSFLFEHHLENVLNSRLLQSLLYLQPLLHDNILELHSQLVAFVFYRVVSLLASIFRNSNDVVKGNWVFFIQ